MRMIFTFAGGQGHLDPLVPLIRAAVAAGHEVSCSGQAGMADLVTALGVPFRASGSSTLFTGKQPMLVPDRERERGGIRTAFAGSLARDRAADLVRVIGELSPDVLVCDEVDFGAMVAAERCGIPHASVVVIASGTFIDRDLVREPLEGLRAGHGLGPDPEVTMPWRHLVLCPVPPAFRHPVRPLPPTGRHIRPAVLETTGRDVDQPGLRPLVYVTLGTIFNLESDDLLARMVAGVRELPVDVLVAVGPHVDPAELGPQPAHVRVESSVPQADVLRTCAAIVCHGGSGTVVGALASGVPLVIAPLGADQLDNAQRCVDLGVGIVLDPLAATGSEVRGAVAAALGKPALRARAEEIARGCSTLPTSADAVRMIEDLVRG